MTDTQKSSKQYELMSLPPFLLAILFFRGGGRNQCSLIDMASSIQFNRSFKYVDFSVNFSEILNGKYGLSNLELLF